MHSGNHQNAGSRHTRVSVNQRRKLALGSLVATGAAARPLPLLDALGERCFTLRHAGDAADCEVLSPNGGSSLWVPELVWNSLQRHAAQM